MGTALLLLSLSLALSLAAVSAALVLRPEVPPRNPEAICSVFREKPEWYRDAGRAAARWGTKVPALMSVMVQESGFDGTARPERERLWGFVPWSRPSTALGYAQVVDGTWADYERVVGGARDRRDFADAADFVAWYLSELGGVLGIPARDLRRLYLAYHEGPAGYRRDTQRDKAWLEQAARRVDERSKRFHAQLEECRDELDASLWWRGFRLGALATLCTVVGAWLLGRRLSRAR